MNSKETILVIEDTLSILQNIAEILEYEEYEVVTARDGDEGIRLAREVFPDLILCDINMPGRDGYEVLKEIRADAKLKVLPFVFLTAQGDRTDVRKGMERGADDYLVKPFGASDLLSAVETRLEQRRQRDEVEKKKWEKFSDEISSMIPHELKTPLNSICTLSEVLRTDWQTMEKSDIEEYLDLMVESGARLKKVTENLSLYSHLRSRRAMSQEDRENETADDPEEFDYLIAAVGESVSAGNDRPDDLVLSLCETGIATRYPGLFGRAFRELLDNAFKFSKKTDKIRVGLRTEGKEIVVTIKDNGSGMTPEQIRSVGALVQFERARREQQGVGMGLALAKEICGFMGGSLALDAGENGGVIATVRLPFEPRNEAKSS